MEPNVQNNVPVYKIKEKLLSFPLMIKKPPISSDEIEEELKKVRKEMELAYNQFQYTTEPELIDSCIYELKAVQIRYDYLINKAKEKHFVQEIEHQSIIEEGKWE
jgi:hypothetical protein